MPRWQQCREVKQTSQVLDEQHDEGASNTATPENTVILVLEKNKNSWEIVSDKI